MDPDSKQIQKQLNDLEIKILKQRSDFLPHGSNVLQSTWLRRTIQASNGLDGFLLDYGFNFLPSCGFISWLIFLITQ
jgi:hypothetical protein